MTKAKFYKKLNNNQVQCQLCNHACIINDGQIGICKVRKNREGNLESLVYGQPAALNVDPIEKKPLFHFLPNSLTFSLGTLGCNFACANCQNWDISQKAPIGPIKNPVPPEEIVKQAIEHNCASISYTYNEPTIWAEYALDIMKLAHEHKLKNVWVSNGYMSKECLKAILPYLDAINVDLKSFNPKFYLTNCQAKLEPILENLKTIKKAKAHLEITTLIIPTLSDNLNMLKKLAEFITHELGTNTPWHLSAFSPEISWKLKNLEPTNKNIIYQAYNIGKNANLKYVYVGNLPGDSKENTYCPNCHELVIRRAGYNIERFDKNEKCQKCGQDLNIVK